MLKPCAVLCGQKDKMWLGAAGRSNSIQYTQENIQPEKLFSDNSIKLLDFNQVGSKYIRIYNA